MGNRIAEEVAVAFKVVDGRIWSCDDAVAGFFFLLLLLGAHCDVDDDDIWSVFVRSGSRVVGADLEEVNGLAGLFFLFSLFRKKKIIRLSAPTKHPK